MQCPDLLRWYDADHIFIGEKTCFLDLCASFQRVENKGFSIFFAVENIAPFIYVPGVQDCVIIVFVLKLPEEKVGNFVWIYQLRELVRSFWAGIVRLFPKGSLLSFWTGWRLPGLWERVLPAKFSVPFCCFVCYKRVVTYREVIWKSIYSWQYLILFIGLM